MLRTPLVRRLANSAHALARPTPRARTLSVAFSTSRPAASKAPAAVPFTSDKFPELVRDSRFGSVTPEHVARFRDITGDVDAAVISAGTNTAQELDVYNEDWMRKYKGRTTLVLRPKTTQEVSAILRYCNEHTLAVVPQGGNTGLVGGSVPVHDEIVISTVRMNAVRSLDEVSGILTAEAGCVLEVLDLHLRERGFCMPLDLGAKGSCNIGGNVASNAGGLRLLRYGSLHGTVLSMEVVLADGTIMELGKPLRKDNTGYDLKQLFIGSEGTLGMITAVSILTPPKSSAVNVAMLGVKSFAEVQEAFRRARLELGEILSAFEFFDRTCMDLVKRHLPIREPLETKSPFYVLIETSGSNKDHDDEKLATFLERLLEEEVVQDGALASDTAQAHAMWNVRESITEACSKEGGNFKYDLSVPVPQLYAIVDAMRARLADLGLLRSDSAPTAPVTNVVGFGHIGDGNLHLNLTTTGWTRELNDAIEPFVYELVQARNGSISAEHGLGLMKAPYLEYSKSPEAIELMRRVKAAFDPKGILNPYKYFPRQ
ncbi:hypothetical protein BDK51DRAFT_16088 [Blyttiomyces helicus]|uniref:FAD-binding PCMH-type domain-containing protein n=1 Tax=Blyttiomyces helicus TaxID=388810 RepID=A0A4P9WGQ5_9FUNG|nr:hypothetical protein BDK51DRAFT_16088 [Blyttiomyces helicus]|eukprot:RKO90558.1 hypothetical protein BDK51DRAFT_16088 [Blyttiomyces helicus]